MPTKLAAALAAAVALSVASPAVAGARDVEQLIGTPSGDGQISGALLVTARGGATARLSFTVGSGVDDPVEISVPLQLPAGARVTAMTSVHGRHTRVARELQSDVARARFEYVLPLGREPVLLERAADELRLRVSVSRMQRVRITLSLTLTRDDSADWMTADPLERGQVSTQTSLFAVAAPVRIPALTISQPAVSVSCDFGGGRPIRRFIELQVPRLRACYSRALLRDKTLAGTVVLHFSVAASGHVSNVSVDGTLTDAPVRECIVDDVERWTLPPAAPDASTTVINYPLNFVLPP